MNKKFFQAMKSAEIGGHWSWRKYWFL